MLNRLTQLVSGLLAVARADYGGTPGKLMHQVVQLSPSLAARASQGAAQPLPPVQQSRLDVFGLGTKYNCCCFWCSWGHTGSCSHNSCSHNSSSTQQWHVLVIVAAVTTQKLVGNCCPYHHGPRRQWNMTVNSAHVPLMCSSSVAQPCC